MGYLELGCPTPLRGDMKSLNTLWMKLAEELASVCHTSATQDCKTFLRRVECEGDSFFTITLPAFAKDFERSLERGRVDSGDFAGFKRSRGPLPSFLGGFLRQIFDTEGLLLDAVSIDCIFAIRQLCCVFGKIQRPASEKRTRDTIKNYVEIDRMVQSHASVISSEARVEFRRMAQILFADVFSKMDETVYYGNINGKHGPGATADRLFGNEKWNLSEWTSRLEKAGIHYLDHVLPSWSYYDQLDHVTIREPEDERPVRVVTVPKTLKTPRIIAIEPTAMQFVQQALLRPLVELLEKDPLVGAFSTIQGLSSSMIGFTDQEPNRRLAMEGSKVNNLATLDLSEASDRVSTWHVEDLLSKWPHFLEAVMACRSTKAMVPGHGEIPLAKFASMGSALCFPFEAMTFLTCVMLGLQDVQGSTLTRKDILSLRAHVRVYGDDIIVPADSVVHVISRLEAFGFKVNNGKSFWNGKFRESCGGDYYDGEWVTPIRLRQELPSSHEDAQEVISLVSFRNQLYTAGLWKTTADLDNMLRKILRHFPIVEITSPLLGRTSVLPYKAEKMSRDTHSPRVRGWAVRTITPPSPLDGIGALRKVLDPLKGKPFEDSRHLERLGRPDAVGTKLRWMAPF